MSKRVIVTGYETHLKFHWAVEPFAENNKPRRDGFFEHESTL